MTDQLTNEAVNEQQIETNSREYWKQEASKLGLSYPNNMQTEKLKDLVQSTIELRAKAKTENGNKGVSNNLGSLAPEVRAMQETATSLVRFKLTVLDPNKRSATGMFVTAGNDNLAPIKRMIPFNVPVWHAERIVVEHLKNIKYTVMKSTYNQTLKASFDDPKARTSMPCFLIEELPPLTEQELLDLQKRQAQQGTGQSQDS